MAVADILFKDKSAAIKHVSIFDVLRARARMCVSKHKWLTDWSIDPISHTKKKKKKSKDKKNHSSFPFDQLNTVRKPPSFKITGQNQKEKNRKLHLFSSYK